MEGVEEQLLMSLRKSNIAQCHIWGVQILQRGVEDGRRWRTKGKGRGWRTKGGRERVEDRGGRA